MKKITQFSILLMTFFSSFICLSQDYYWSSTSNPSFYLESNWSLQTTGESIPSNSINPNTSINKDLIIENSTTIIGKVGATILMGSGTLGLNKSQIVMNTNYDYGINMQTGKNLDLDDARIHSSFIYNATITLNNNSHIYLKNESDPLTNTTINIESDLAKVFFENIQPSDVAADYLSSISISGSPAVSGENVYLKQYYNGTMVHSKEQDQSAMTAYSYINYGGGSVDVSSFERLTDADVPFGNNVMSSFVLRKGYMAVFAENNDGTGERETFIADKDDLFVPNLGAYSLNNKVSLLRVMQWDQVNKKGNAAWVSDELNDELDLDWFYNWSDWKTSTLDSEYVTMVWGGDLVANGLTDTLINNYEGREDINTVLGFNEPDLCYAQSGQYYNMCDVSTAVGYYQELLSLGLRTGAPAVTGSPDGFQWLDDFMTEATAQNLHVDFIPVHYYGQVDATTFMGYWEAIYEKWGLPIWVTEFNYGGPWETTIPTTDVHNTAVKEWVAAMDEADYIERYAFFSFSDDEYEGFWSSVDNGTLNSLGEWWRDHEAPEAFANFQDNTDCNGVTNGYAFIDNCGICVSGNTKTIIEDSCSSNLDSKDIDTKQAITLNTISAYPNPVTDYLTIDSNTSNNKVIIYNISGKQLLSTSLTYGANTIDLAELSSGTFILKFSDGTYLNIIKK